MPSPRCFARFFVGALCLFCVLRERIASSQSEIDDHEITKDGMIAEIKRLGTTYLGKYVQVIPEKTGTVFREHWLSTDGQVGQYRYRQPGEGEFSFCYSNSIYRLDIFATRINESKLRTDFLGVDLPSPAYYADVVGLSNGWIPDLRVKFNDVIASPDCKVSVQRKQFSGQALESLVLKSRYGIAIYGFEKGRVVFFRTIIQKGTALPSFESANEPEAPLILNNGIGETYVQTLGRLKYDEKGIISRCESNVFWVKDESGAVIKEFPGRIYPALYKVRPLRSGELSADRLNIEQFGFPKKVTVRIKNAVVPYELRDGRLVKISDARAESVARESGFRKPSAWHRWKYGIVLVLVLVLGAAWWYAKRSSSSD